MSTTASNEPAPPARIFLIQYDGVIYVTTSVWEYRTSDRALSEDERISAHQLEAALHEARLHGANVASVSAMQLSLRGQTIPGPKLEVPIAFYGQTINPGAKK